METMKRVMMKKTKIICTIADNRCEEEFIRQLYENGMNVVRINSAHASIEGAWKIVDNVRKVSSKIGILIDTKGPEVRLTGMADAVGFVAHTGDIVEIIDDPSGQCTKGTLYTTYPGMSEDVPVGSDILIDDGSVDLSVIGKSEGKLVCKVMNEGVIKGHKSVNVPSVHINLPALTDKDRTFIRWAVDADIDFIAHSFVRSADDLKEIQDILDAEGSHLKIISKIENQQGIDNLDDILTASYGIMVARGDLGVEIPAERIPLVQKHIVQMCRSRKKPVIVATQMLQSMIDNPRPTRAEVTDIANAIFQSADAVMLSGESAYGKYPVEAVKTMTDIAFETEQAIEENLDLDLRKAVKPVAVVLARSLVAATRELPVKALVFDTYTGRVGRYLSTFRPKVPLYAMCYNNYTMRELALVFGVNAYPFGKVRDKEEFAAKSIEILIKEGKIRHGDLVGFIGGVFGEQVGATYMEIKYI
ncbi:MAG: pyruvate kinase [Candidatus Cryptobacteroides sp.]|nr:pyruvate kinase [Candidatus Cryptobacteroides sp.]